MIAKLIVGVRTPIILEDEHYVIHNEVMTIFRSIVPIAGGALLTTKRFHWQPIYARLPILNKLHRRISTIDIPLLSIVNVTTPRSLLVKVMYLGFDARLEIRAVNGDVYRFYTAAAAKWRTRIENLIDNSA